jgi:LPS sulfotransferase NodH
LFQRRTSPNGVFSYKWNSNFQALEGASRVTRTLTPRRNVFIDRKDLDAQAKSFLVASKTGIWARQKDIKYSMEAPDLSSEVMEHAKEKLSEVRAKTLAILQAEGGSPLTVYGEDLFAEPATVVKSVMEHCDVSTEGLALPETASQTAPSAARKAR